VINRDRVLEVWQGRDHPWLPWVKPAVFDRIEEREEGTVDEFTPARSVRKAIAQVDTSWLLPRAAVIIDVPGGEAALLALALGKRGLRPVPAINTTSCPGAELISQTLLRLVLVAGAECEDSFPSGPTLGPAFLLDSRRDGHEGAPSPGMFDNRWVVFRTDLPSEKQLRDNGIERVIVVQEDDILSTDLEDILLDYQAGGLELIRHETRTRSSHPWTLAKRGWLAKAARFVQLRWAVLRRLDGSYGRWVPIPPKPSHG